MIAGLPSLEDPVALPFFQSETAGEARADLDGMADAAAAQVRVLGVGGCMRGCAWGLQCRSCGAVELLWSCGPDRGW